MINFIPSFLRKKKPEKSKNFIKKIFSNENETNSEKNNEKVDDKKIHESEIKSIIRSLESVDFKEFIMYVRSPRVIIMNNLLAGIFRGLGIVIGMTMVLAILIWVLTKLVDFPLIGQYFQIVLDFIQENLRNSPIR